MSNISGGTQRPRRSQQTRLTEKLAPETKPRQPAMRQPKGRSQRLIEEEARRSAPPKTRGTPTGKRPSAPKRKTTRKLLVMLISLTCTAGLLLLAAPQMLGMELAGLPTLAFVNGSIIRYDAERIANFNEAVALVNTDRIFPGVTIDGINVGGMTRADAESALGQGGVDNSSVNLHVVADAYTYDITGYDVPLGSCLCRWAREHNRPARFGADAAERARRDDSRDAAKPRDASDANYLRPRCRAKNRGEYRGGCDLHARQRDGGVL